MAHWLLLILAFIAPSVATAGIFENHAGVRSAAMGGAQRAIGSSNEAIYLNPASMAAFRRFGIDMELAYEKPKNLRRMRITAVDSKTSAMAAGIGYETIDNIEGLPSLKRTSVALAYPLGQYLFFGSTGHYITGSRLEGEEETPLELFNTDVGITLNLSDILQFGMSWHNVLETDERALSPESMGFGLAGGNEIFVGALDVRLLDDEDGNRQTTYHAGAELFLAGAIPVRLGYTQKPEEADPTKSEHFISGGLAYVTKTGALGLSLQRSLAEGAPWNISGAIKFFM